MKAISRRPIIAMLSLKRSKVNKKGDDGFD